MIRKPFSSVENSVAFRNVSAFVANDGCVCSRQKVVAYQSMEWIISHEAREAHAALILS